MKIINDGCILVCEDGDIPLESDLEVVKEYLNIISTYHGAGKWNKMQLLWVLFISDHEHHCHLSVLIPSHWQDRYF